MIADDRNPLLARTQNEDGSVIIIALLILAVMTVIGLMSADITVTENYIIRNQGIYRQNVNLVEAAVMEGLQELIQVDANDPANLDPNTDPNDWINSDDAAWTSGSWYDPDFSGMLLNANNSVVPDMIQDDAAGNITILETRGEDDLGNLRIAVVGWEAAPGASLSATQPVRRAGRIIAEYASLDAGGNNNGYGMLRMEIGVERVF